MNYSTEVADLLQSEALCELGPGKPNQQIRSSLSALSAESLAHPSAVADRDMAACCISGLWLLHNFLDESHTISQDIHSPSGSYWHAIMHRREPDFSNSKYWFRRVGDHEVFQPLCGGARELAEATETDKAAEFLANQSTWDPFRFVDLCEAATDGRSSCEELCRQVAQLEWQLLFDNCYRHAIGE